MAVDLPPWTEMLPVDPTLKWGPGPHLPSAEAPERWLRAPLRHLSADELAWLASPEVVCERRYARYSGTENNTYWGHEWSLRRASDNALFGLLLLTSYFRESRSTLCLDDGTGEADVVTRSAADRALMWSRTIARARARAPFL
jgi:hypothetical protein